MGAVVQYGYCTAPHHHGTSPAASHRFGPASTGDIELPNLRHLDRAGFNRSWRAVASSADGTKLVAVKYGRQHNITYVALYRKNTFPIPMSHNITKSPTVGCIATALW